MPDPDPTASTAWSAADLPGTPAPERPDTGSVPTGPIGRSGRGDPEPPPPPPLASAPTTTAPVPPPLDGPAPTSGGPVGRPGQPTRKVPAVGGPASPTPRGPRSRHGDGPGPDGDGAGPGGVGAPPVDDEVRPPPIRHSTGPVGYPPVPQVNTTTVRSAAAPQPVMPASGPWPDDDEPVGFIDGVDLPTDDLVGADPYDDIEVDDPASADGRPRSRRGLLLGLGAVLLIVAGIAAVAGFRPDRSTPDGPGGPSVDELARSTVQIVGLDGADQPLCSGSGTLVSTDGMILTNAHVVTPDAVCNFESLGIAMTSDAGRPPDLLYRGELLAIDAELDLAVITVGRPLDEGVTGLPGFPAIALGDSDEVHIGDSLRIFGYPEIGGETITFTNGSVSGFTAQAGIGDRALIKTDATIAGGNSGGAAVDATGLLIGIPTKARASESGPAVDCRPLADTNADGQVDERDNCVPIGGFLNGLRPINLAKDLIAQASAASPQALEPVREDVEVDVEDVRVTRPRFSLGESSNAPVEIVRTATAGIAELCLFVDWEGIPEGAEWDGLWYKDMELVEDFSLVAQRWEFGSAGNNFWMCAIDSDDGLTAGLYELGFFLDGELVFAEGIVVTESPAPLYETMWENTTDGGICGLAVNPVGSGPVGLNELDPGATIAPGESIALQLPAGDVVVEASDCEGQVVADSGPDGLEIEPDRVYFIAAPTAGESGGDVLETELGP